MHKPVMLEQAMEALRLKKDGWYVDATLGRGGHAQAIIERLDGQARVWGFDKDPEAVRHCNEKFAGQPLEVLHASYAQMAQSLEKIAVNGKVDGVLFDLGVSSPQLDQGERGFSFMRPGPLDMRMDTTHGPQAQDWPATVPVSVLERALKEYGEERYAGHVARAIVARRKTKPFTDTLDLAEVVKEAIPNWQPGKHPATKTFQAIRMQINNEIDDLVLGLEQAISVLKPGGRLVVISFHSGEDIRVKRMIQKYCRGNEDVASGQAKQVLLKKVGKAVYAHHAEVSDNPRARSAIMRVAERLSENKLNERSRV